MFLMYYLNEKGERVYTLAVSDEDWFWGHNKCGYVGNPNR